MNRVWTKGDFNTPRNKLGYMHRICAKDIRQIASYNEESGHLEGHTITWSPSPRKSPIGMYTVLSENRTRRYRAGDAVWAYHHGDVPDGAMVHYKDMDGNNPRLSNLMLIDIALFRRSRGDSRVLFVEDIVSTNAKLNLALELEHMLKRYGAKINSRLDVYLAPSKSHLSLYYLKNDIDKLKTELAALANKYTLE